MNALSSGSISRALLSACLLVVTGACTVGPDYHPPRSSLPTRFAESTESRARPLPDDGAAWWTSFHDPVLNRLIDAALQSAPTIAQANARVREARAMVGISGTALLPNASADAAFKRNLGSQNLPVGVPPGGLGRGVHSNLFQAGFDASWEIDVFGGIRRGIESSDAGYEAAIEDRRDAILTLAAEIARTYMDLRGMQEQLDVARRNLVIQQDALAITTVQLKAGLAPVLDPLRANAEVEGTQADIPVLQADIRGAIYRIGALVGRTPEDLLTQLEQPRPLPALDPDPPLGLPSDLLLRRPDVSAAERRIQQENAKIGVATADYYPHFSLTGVTGIESLDASKFLTGASLYYQVGPSMNWLIFDAGRTRFRIQAEQARTDRAQATYQQDVLNALRDVEAAMVTYAKAQIRYRHLKQEREQEARALSVARRLYASGNENFLTVLDAQRTLYLVEDQLAKSDRDCATDLVALFKALGGGWQGTDRG
ncbi:efflux transporter outer membrane subunit [Nguyenibacter vanlangensis]|uniref:Efflux transporter outer membrane subunit n=1 Tax=Nguyenibacter vanlangensis TaxID=1216886 RepID=A0ABZ3DAA7_9PROT